jgi:hypothetical protein
MTLTGGRSAPSSGSDYGCVVRPGTACSSEGLDAGVETPSVGVDRALWLDRWEATASMLSVPPARQARRAMVAHLVRLCLAATVLFRSTL